MPRIRIRARGPCAHCGTVRTLFPRDLCDPCYRRREVRALYPVKFVYRTWTAREARDLADYLAGGMTTRQAAAALGRTYGSTQGMRHREGLSKYKKYDAKRDEKVARLLRKGLGVVEAARRSGLLSHTGVRRLAKRLGLATTDNRRPSQARLRHSEFVADGIYRFHTGRERERVEVATEGWPAGCTRKQSQLIAAVIAGHDSFPKIGKALGRSANCVQQMAYKLRDLGWIRLTRRPGKRPVVTVNWGHPDWDDRPIRLKHGPREEMTA